MTQPLQVAIADPTRFTPAGMDTANRVVCARVLQELDAVADSISNTALCGWDYVCDYKADRFPNYLFKARCRTSTCNGNCNQEDNSHNRCQSHGVHVTVLQMRYCGECMGLGTRTPSNSLYMYKWCYDECLKHQN